MYRNEERKSSLLLVKETVLSRSLYKPKKGNVTRRSLRTQDTNEGGGTDPYVVHLVSGVNR